MIGFWSALGLCNIDPEFRREVVEKCASGNQEDLYDLLRSKLSLPISTFEVEDLRRLVSIDGFVQTLEVEQALGWPNGCPSGITPQESVEVAPPGDPFQSKAVLDVLESTSKKFESLVRAHRRRAA